MATANAQSAGVADACHFDTRPFSATARPDGPPGLVMVNPPYGARIGQKDMLYGLYGAFGAVMAERFAGWRVGLVTSHPGLARATNLPFGEPGPVIAHGGLKVKLYQTGPLPRM